MLHSETPLKIVKFAVDDYDLAQLAERLTVLKAAATRTPTPITVEQLQSIGNSETSVLLLQVAEDGEESLVVGMVHLAISYLEDRAHLGPICVDKDSTPRGHGTPLMQAAIDYVKNNFTGLRRLDLSNRPSHDLATWYDKFGFVPRSEESGDPTNVYRLPL